jgi:hypothetical protein
MRRLHPASRVLAALLAVQLALPAGLLHAASGTKVGHDSPKNYIPGFRINIETRIEDPEGVLLARCYFRSRKDPAFVFADLAAAGKTWKTTLPAPWLGSEEVEYLFVVVNRSKKVFRSESFRIPEKKTPQLKKWQEIGEVREVRLDRLQEFAELYVLLRNELRSSWQRKLPDWQEPVSNAALDISTEQAAASAQLGGFWDTVAVHEVPAHLAFGQLVEGIYPAAQAATSGAAAVSATTAATGATAVGSAGTIGGGSSWIWWTLGAAAVIGGGAAAVVSSGVIDDLTGNTDVRDATAADFVGTYDAIDPRYPASVFRAVFVFNSGGTGAITQYVNGVRSDKSMNWSFNEVTDTIFFSVPGGGSASGHVTGTVKSFTLTGLYSDGSSAINKLTRR